MFHVWMLKDAFSAHKCSELYTSLLDVLKHSSEKSLKESQLLICSRALRRTTVTGVPRESQYPTVRETLHI